MDTFKKQVNKKLILLKSNPSKFLMYGFAILIAIGTLLLMLPIASKNGQSIGFINALFTATSAMCVTGLAVVNTASHWTPFGKFIILIWLQIGGLGFLSLTTLAIVIGRGQITLRDRLIIKEDLNLQTLKGIVKFVKYVFYSTLIIEGIGAFLLTLIFLPDYGFWKSIQLGVFHSISAFCNAGFDLLGNSLENYNGNPFMIIVVSFLIILGGLGFTVYRDLIKNKFDFKRYTSHTQMVLIMSSSLIILGMILIFIADFNNPNTLQNLPFSEKILGVFFQSVTLRTAGFDSISIGLFSNASIFIMILFMFIGGSSGSTAGGVKTTTIGIVILRVINSLKGRKDNVFFKRRLAEENYNKAIIIIIVSLFIIFVMTFLLLITDPQFTFIQILFEAVSAFATVGLTTGITPELSFAGKLIITLGMFIGRVGQITMINAFIGRINEKDNLIRYSETNISVG